MATEARARASERQRPGRKDELDLKVTATTAIGDGADETGKVGLRPPRSARPIASDIRVQRVRIGLPRLGKSPMLRRRGDGRHQQTVVRRS
jgi:hypothetical protein